MNKKFDCVEMKHQAARIIQKKISKLSRSEELEYWKNQAADMRKQQKELLNRTRIM